MRTLQIHEDDIGQVSIEILANYKAYPGHFWKNGLPIYSLERDSASLNALNIPVRVVTEIASKFFPPFQRVTVGYGHSYSEWSNAAAFGFLENCAAIFEYDDSIVSHVWFLLSAPTRDHIARVGELVTDLSSLGSLLIQAGSCQAQCSDPEALARFFSSDENWK
jgi:hypothetical protein